MNKHYPITATFIDEISWDIESQNWSKKDWVKDLKAMKKVGIDTIIFIRGGLNNKCIYPSKEFPTIYTEDNDLLGNILEAANKLSINIYIGLYMSTINWDNGNYQKMAEQNSTFIDEVLTRYGNYKNFIGWYIPTEINCVEFNIVETINALMKVIKAKSPDKLTYWCPLFKTREVTKIENELTPENTTEVWREILGKIDNQVDAMSFTDGTAPLDILEDYIKATKTVCDEHGIEYWANVELLQRHKQKFIPVEFDILKKKIEIHQKYASKMNCFEFSHFMSPHAKDKKARALYKQYKSYFTKEK